MGNRVMEKPNLSGGTVARHHVPKVVRRSRKRAVRKAAGAGKLVEPVDRLKPVSVPVPARRVAAKALKPRKLVEQPPRKPAVRVAAKAPEPARPAPIERPTQKPVPQIAAKAAQLPKPVELPSPKAAPEAVAKSPKPRRLFERLTLRRAPQKPPEVEKPQEPAAQTPASAPEPAVEKSRPIPVDTFEDGAIEWGIKREGEDEGSKP